MREAGYTGAIFGVTGNVLPSDVEHFLSKGADVVLGKPLKISELKVSGADSGREMGGGVQTNYFISFYFILFYFIFLFYFILF